MRTLAWPAVAFVLALAACGGPKLETRTFELKYLAPSDAEALVTPYVYTQRTDAPGQVTSTRNTISVRETRDNLEQIARALDEHDRAPAAVRILFQVIRADGATTPDTSIAAVERQLRQLFRFRGYSLVAQGLQTGEPGSPIVLRLTGNTENGWPYEVHGAIIRVNPGDSGNVRLHVQLKAGPFDVLATDLTIGLGQTMVLGGQPGSTPGAIILAVKPELVR